MEKILDRDFLAGLVLLFIGIVAWAESGSDAMNWVFPHLAIYVVLGIASVLVGRVLLGTIVRHVPDVIGMDAEDRTAFVDVLLFLLIVLGYLVVMYGLGFWLASLIMLALTSLRLTQDRTLGNIGLALVAPLATCIVAYFVFQHVFYVPVPEASWW